MKRPILVAALFLAGVLLALFLATFPTKRWWKLERLGHVPEDVSRATREGESEWRLSESTTWWGRPIAPAGFWKGRVVWNDESAQDAAHRYGRGYPPIPEHLTNLTAGFPLSSRSHADIVPSPWSGGLDGGRVTPFHLTDAENAYWGWFWRTKPKPPPTLEREQFDVAETILRMRKPLMIRGVDFHASIPARERANSEGTQKRRAQEIGVPAEALTEEALFWAYVMRQRQEYAKEQAQAAQWKSHGQGIAEGFLARFLDRLLVDTNLIINPLTEEQRSAANGWKVAYLQRLRREKTDESYLNAYLAAWKLDHAQVFQEEMRK
jgi:hypothetical protein